ncbi:hypothetical protein Ct61P_13192 [Colletotrichum tofieldiae]|nr:hypothetical protein Ct61P_13192 [Colletotrichum tofieldiae]
MVLESLYVGSEKVSAIGSAAKKLDVRVSMGISEKVQNGSVTLFNSNVISGSDGDILTHHRKLMPTFL